MAFSHRLHSAFIPRSVAVVGASVQPHRRGTLIWNSVKNCRPLVEAYPVNPKYHVLEHYPCWATLRELPTVVDLVVIATPSEHVLGVLEDCAQCGIKNALIPPGDPLYTTDRHWRDEIVAFAKANGIRLIGPDSVGIMRPDIGLNVSYWPDLPEAGHVALLCQSGSVTATVLDYAKRCAFGFSSIITSGLESDVNLAEILDFLTADPQTEIIALHIETLKHPRRFYSALRAAVRCKPVILLKAGRGPSASRLIAARTATLSSDDDVFDALLARAGAIRCDRIEEFCSTLEVFSTQKQPRNGRLAIMANGLGFCALAGDAADAHGIALARLSHESTAQLQTLLESPLTITNPIDIGANPPPEHIEQTLHVLLKDNQVDGVCIYLAPSTAMNSPATVDAIGRAAQSSFKPVIVTWMSESIPESVQRQLQRNALPTLLTPDLSAKAFLHLVQYERLKELRLNTPQEGSEQFSLDLDGARDFIARIRQENRHRLTEPQSHRLLRYFGIETVPGQLALTPEEAVVHAEAIGYPVALKLCANGVGHKTDVGGILLHVSDPTELVYGFEKIKTNCRQFAPFAEFIGIYVQKMAHRRSSRKLQLSVFTDPTLGPSIRIGSGGRAGEVFDDVQIGIPPLTEPIVRDMIDRTHIRRALTRYRGLPDANLPALVRTVMRLSTMISELPCIAELSINPLLVDENGALALDANVSLNHAASTPDSDYSHLLIAPTSLAVSQPLDTRLGAMTLRSIRADDYAALKRLLGRISNRSAYLRFHKKAEDITHNELIDFTQIDHDRDCAVVVTDNGNEGEIHAVARFAHTPGQNMAEFGILVEDSHQCLGLGSKLMQCLEDRARERGIAQLVGYILKDNGGMAALMRRRGFTSKPYPQDDSMLTYTLNL